MESRAAAVIRPTSWGWRPGMARPTGLPPATSNFDLPASIFAPNAKSDHDQEHVSRSMSAKRSRPIGPSHIPISEVDAEKVGSATIAFCGNDDTAGIMDTKPTVRESGGAWDSKEQEHLKNKAVKEILEPAAPVETSASVESAVDQLKTQTSDSAPVTNPEGTLVGRVSADQMIRGATGRGHDPKTTSVEGQMHKDGEPYCYENESIAKAEEVMSEAKADELSVVSDEKKLVGKATRGAIEEEKRSSKS